MIGKKLLVTLADEKYIEQAKQLFSSAYWNGGWDGDFMLLSYEIPENKLKDFRDRGILIKRIKPLKELTKDKWVMITLSKFYLFTDYFKKWDNIVFLDNDIIVRKSIKKLADLNKFNGVTDAFPNVRDQFKYGVRGGQKKVGENFDLSEKTFNSGVMAFSSDVIKKDTFNRLKKICEKYLSCSNPGEQGIINLYFYQRWNELPFAWNFNPLHVINPFKKTKNLDIGVLWHFMGTKKPWLMENYFYDEWKKNLDKFANTNFRKPQKYAEELGDGEIIRQSKIVTKKYKYYASHRFIDRNIGKIGIALKKHSPKMYIKMKKIMPY
jgi:lipopolysaccharide biosynthesis glycosyltransferase